MYECVCCNWPQYCERRFRWASLSAWTCALCACSRTCERTSTRSTRTAWRSRSCASSACSSGCCSRLSKTFCQWPSLTTSALLCSPIYCIYSYIYIYIYICKRSSVCLMVHERLGLLLQGYDSDGREGHAAHPVHCDLPRRPSAHRVSFHQTFTLQSRLCTQWPYHTTCRLISRLMFINFWWLL